MPAAAALRGLLVPLLATIALVIGPSAVAGPGYHDPEVGECHDYGIRGLLAVSDSRDPVPCDQAHRALTVAVLRVPRRVGPLDPAKAFAAVGTRCYKALSATLGGTTRERAMTAYTLAFFLPSKSERRHGARWVRCDLVLEGGTKLQAVPDPLLPRPLDDSVQRCLQIRHGVALATVCSRRHDYRAAGVLKFNGPYRSPRRFYSIAVQRCPKLAGDRFYFNYPSREAWKAGDKVMVCSKHTKH
jgi:hypothetical protein